MAAMMGFKDEKEEIQSDFPLSEKANKPKADILCCEVTFLIKKV